MKRYEVLITEIYSRIVEVMAEDEAHAEAIVEHDRQNGRILLNADDFETATLHAYDPNYNPFEQTTLY